MTQQELESLYLTTENGVFTPNFTYTGFDQETETYTGLVIHKTAQEVYDEWLYNRDNPPTPQPTKLERIAALEEMNAKLLLEIAMMKGGL